MKKLKMKRAGYLPPEEVMRGSGHKWQWERTLYDNGEDGWSVVEGKWKEDKDGEWEQALAIRWNGNDEKAPPGFPNRGRFGTWFMLPPELHGAVRRVVRKLQSE